MIYKDKIYDRDYAGRNKLEEILIRQVAFLYHDRGITQQKIADKFSLSKMAVSRMLQRAKELGIVRTIVSLPFELNKGLQQQIKRKYELKEVIVAKKPVVKDKSNLHNLQDDAASIRALLGKVCAFYMGISPLDNYVLGVGVGKTIGQVVENLVPMRTKNLHVVQLMGGLASVGEQNPFTIVQEICRKLQAKGTYFTSFAVVENEEIKNSIFNSSMGRQVKDMWRKCRKVLFGVGAIEKGTLLSPKLVSVKELKEIKKSGAVGDILGHCFDKDGNFVDTDLEKRLVSIPVDMLKNIPERVAVAGGEYKTQAIQGLLRSGLVTGLVTDEATARKIASM